VRRTQFGAWCVLFFLVLDSPFEWLVGYHDPRHPEVDPLHEWQFRSGLDRYIWIWGMICAYMHPTFERALNWLDSINQSNAVVIRAAIVAGAFCSAGYITKWHCVVRCAMEGPLEGPPPKPHQVSPLVGTVVLRAQHRAPCSTTERF
jgi:hypothetical protein